MVLAQCNKSSFAIETTYCNSIQFPVLFKKKKKIGTKFIFKMSDMNNAFNQPCQKCFRVVHDILSVVNIERVSMLLHIRIHYSIY